MLECQRHRFQLPPDLHYLNCAYMAPLAREVEEAGLEGMARRRDPSSIGPDDFFAQADALRERFTRLIGGADPRRVAIIPAALLRHFPPPRATPGSRRAQNIVILGEQFPSNVYAWMRKAGESGAELRTVARPGTGDPGPGAAWNRAAAGGGRRRNGGGRPAGRPLGGRHALQRGRGRAARARGRCDRRDRRHAVDRRDAHFDVQEVAPDALVVAGYKTLFGPYQSGLAWFGERFDGGVPLEEPWAARKSSELFVAGRLEYVPEYRPAAARYDVGERSNQIQLPMLNAALDMVLGWRPERVQEYCAKLLQPFEDTFREAGFALEHRSFRGAHLFGAALAARSRCRRDRDGPATGAGGRFGSRHGRSGWRPKSTTTHPTSRRWRQRSARSEGVGGWTVLAPRRAIRCNQRDICDRICHKCSKNRITAIPGSGVLEFPDQAVDGDLCVTGLGDRVGTCNARTGAPLGPRPLGAAN